MSICLQKPAPKAPPPTPTPKTPMVSKQALPHPRQSVIKNPNIGKNEYGWGSLYRYFANGFRHFGDGFQLRDAALCQRHRLPLQLSRAGECIYDRLGHTTQFTEKIDGQNYTTSYDYDQYSNLTKTTYPSGFEVKNSYDTQKGFLTSMYNDNNTFYIPQQYNALGQLKQYKFGNNNTVASFTYNANHLPDLWQVGNWKYDYDFKATTGNLTNRKQTSIPVLTEAFDYDVFNRLSYHQVAGKSPGYTGYYDNGNIDYHSNSKISLTYSSTKPNAVEKVEDQSGVISTIQQDITYTAFNKAEKITEGDYELTYTYGTDQQRKKSVLKKISTGTVEKTILYASNYEKIQKGSDTYEVCYLPSPQGLQIVAVKKNTDTEKIFYIYTDHLGSLLTVTDAAGNKVYEQNFDAWGRERNPSDWTPLLRGAGGVSKPDWLIRGYTGHEHLPEFALINMNGRMYDPVLGRMLSPDNFVQDATGTQGYNRYSYALNNPLKYTDPTGEIFVIDDLVLGVIGGAINLATNWGNINNVWQGLGYFGVGFAGGALAEYISPVGSAALVGAGNAALGSYINTGHVDAGAVIQGAVVSGIVGGITMGIGGALSPVADKALSGIASPVLRGAITQGVVGLGVGGIGGGLGAVMNGGNFWEGAGQGALWGAGIGLATGAYTGYSAARTQGLDPWTGKPNTVNLANAEITTANPNKNYVNAELGVNNDQQIVDAYNQFARMYGQTEITALPSENIGFSGTLPNGVQYGASLSYGNTSNPTGWTLKTTTYSPPTLPQGQWLYLRLRKD